MPGVLSGLCCTRMKGIDTSAAGGATSEPEGVSAGSGAGKAGGGSLRRTRRSSVDSAGSTPAGRRAGDAEEMHEPEGGACQTRIHKAHQHIGP